MWWWCNDCISVIITSDVTPRWPDHPMMIETLTCVVAAVVCCCLPPAIHHPAHISGVWSLNADHHQDSDPETGKLSECSLSASIARSPVIIYARTSFFVFYVWLREINHMQWWELLYWWRNLPVFWGRNFIVCNHPISNLIVKSQDCRNDNYCLMEKIWLFFVFLFPLERVRFGLKSHQDYENGRPLTLITSPDLLSQEFGSFHLSVRGYLRISDDVI